MGWVGKSRSRISTNVFAQRIDDDLFPFLQSLGHFGHVACDLSEFHFPSFESVVMDDETHVVPVIGPDRFRGNRQDVRTPRHGDLDLGGHPRPQSAWGILDFDDSLEVLDVCAPTDCGQRSYRGDMALDLLVWRPFDLHLGPHPRTNSLYDCLVQYGHDLHVVQIREVEEVLFLPHGQTWLNNEGPIAIVRVNDKTVVRSADRAVFNLLLQQGEPIAMALESKLRRPQDCLRLRHRPFEHPSGFRAP